MHSIRKHDCILHYKYFFVSLSDTEFDFLWIAWYKVLGKQVPAWLRICFPNETALAGVHAVQSTNVYSAGRNELVPLTDYQS
jgi:hypothetical protein